MIHLLGEGRLSWPQAEQALKRFGTVTLHTPNNQRATFDTWHLGKNATLQATVTAFNPQFSHRSERDDDLSAQLVSEEFTLELGSGMLFGIDPVGSKCYAIGLMPYQMTPTHWLKVTVLRQLHGHRVRLEAVIPETTTEVYPLNPQRLPAPPAATRQPRHIDGAA